MLKAINSITKMVLIFFAISIYGEDIYLKDGTVIKQITIKAFDGEKYIIDSKFGEMTIPTNAINKVIYEVEKDSENTKQNTNNQIETQKDTRYQKDFDKSLTTHTTGRYNIFFRPVYNFEGKGRIDDDYLGSYEGYVKKRFDLGLGLRYNLKDDFYIALGINLNSFFEYDVNDTRIDSIYLELGPKMFGDITRTILQLGFSFPKYNHTEFLGYKINYENGIYFGIGIGLKLTKNSTLELMYMINNIDYNLYYYDEILGSGKFSYERFSLAYNYHFDIIK